MQLTGQRLAIFWFWWKITSIKKVKSFFKQFRRKYPWHISILNTTWKFFFIIESINKCKHHQIFPIFEKNFVEQFEKQHCSIKIFIFHSSIDELSKNKNEELFGSLCRNISFLYWERNLVWDWFGSFEGNHIVRKHFKRRKYNESIVEIWKQITELKCYRFEKLQYFVLWKWRENIWRNQTILTHIYFKKWNFKKRQKQLLKPKDIQV